METGDRTTGRASRRPPAQRLIVFVCFSQKEREGDRFNGLVVVVLVVTGIARLCFFIKRIKTIFKNICIIWTFPLTSFLR